jgi:hypothetical protein
MALIDREAALSMRFSEGYDKDGVMFVPLREVTDHIKAIPPAEPVEAIPVEWIEAEIKYLKAANFEFTARAANHIEAMLKKWRGEQGTVSVRADGICRVFQCQCRLDPLREGA